MAEITIDALLSLALSEDGYLEKATPSQEDDFYANAGSNNYTKYSMDLQQQVCSL